MRKETEMLFDHVLRDNLSPLELLTADYSFINRELGAHYGMSGIKGNEFRRVSLSGEERNGTWTWKLTDRICKWRGYFSGGSRNLCDEQDFRLHSTPTTR